MLPRSQRGVSPYTHTHTHVGHTLAHRTRWHTPRYLWNRWDARLEETLEVWKSGKFHCKYARAESMGVWLSAFICASAAVMNSCNVWDTIGSHMYAPPNKEKISGWPKQYAHQKQMLPFYLCAARISAELPQTTSTRNVEATDINLLNVPIAENNIKTDGSVCANWPASFLSNNSILASQKYFSRAFQCCCYFSYHYDLLLCLVFERK